MKNRILLISLVVVLALGVGLIGCEQPPADAVVSESAGNLTVRKEGAASWIEAGIGTILGPEDVIKCGDNSSGKITFLDGSTVELDPGTELKVVELSVFTDTDPVIIRLKLIIGSIIFRVVNIIDPASIYEVETPTGGGAIRGSAMQVTVSEDGTTLVCNLEGDIWAIAQGVELQILEGQCCVIRPGQSPELIVVVFADPNLEAVIREEIGKPTGDIYPSDLDGLTSLSATEKNITDLTGLESATGLTYLDLRYNRVGSILPLTDLTVMTHLYLAYNQISDISPLTNLANLAELGLGYNEISDISPVASLNSLTTLGLVSNQISNISPLASLSGLTWLNLGSNQISDISPLANLTNLTQLSLGYNQIGGISPLANLTGLTQLYLMHNQITDIAPLVANLGLGDGDAVNLENNPLNSDSVNIYIPQLEARGVNVEYLSLLSPAVGAIGVQITNIDFAWTDVNGADEYDWVLSPNPDLSSPIATKIGLSSAACTYTGTLAYDTPYYWQVTAYKEGAFINGSSIGTFSTIPVPP